MKSTRLWIVRIVSLIAIVIAVLYLLPILIELFKQNLQGDNLGLFIVVTYLTVTSILGGMVWAKETWINNSPFFKVVVGINAVLLGILFFIFTYSSWLLLVCSIAGFYMWFNRLLKKQTSTATNLAVISIISIALSIYVVANVLS